MARKDTEQYQSYAKDAFDNPPRAPLACTAAIGR